jgi:hypothetical protein
MKFSLLLTVVVLGATFLSAPVITAQYLEQKPNTSFDLKDKASELGITPGQLTQIINSSQNLGNSGGDPLPDAMQKRSFTGAVAGDNFGRSVSSAGDVNGDGYKDIIVGAPNNDAAGSNAGRAYIYFGGQTTDITPDIIFNGEAASDNFGFSVSCAGDVNGDGYSDVIVGAPGNDRNVTNSGTAYIYFGGQIMNNNVDVILTGAGADDSFGFSVAGAGDVNSDGYSDVIVGAYLNDGVASNAGRAYIYYGGIVMNSDRDITFNGQAVNDQFGYSVSSAGDVNGDGFSDVIVGAYLNDGGGTNSGRAYIYYGGSSMDATADVVMTGAAASDVLGTSVSSAGDVNDDGYSDVIVSAPGNDAALSNAGRVYIYLGGSAMNNNADVLLDGKAIDDQFGNSVASAGDVNGDGFSDVIVGAQYNDAGGSGAGRAYVYFGGSVMNNITDAILNSEAANDRFGISVASAGDFNGDGYSDIIAGAYWNDANGTDAGKAYLFTNTLTGYDIADEVFNGETDLDYLGYAVSSAGDVNGDGFSDIIVGAPYNDAGGISAGRAYIYYGGTTMDNVADVSFTGEAEDNEFAVSVSSAGDVNGDGYSDVIIGARYNDGGGDHSGRAYVYYGGTNMDNIADVTFTGEAEFNDFGTSVSSAGDINGDGYSDVIVGAPRYGPNNNGKVYVYLGGTNMDNVADATDTGNHESGNFGYSVSSAGDVNGDGYSDVIVGQPYYSPVGYELTGRAYIFWGRTDLPNFRENVTLTGDGNIQEFGTSVSSAGDVNGDGYSDVIVGAWDYDAGNGNDSGRAYIYFGGVDMDYNADVIMIGVGDYSRFGTTVSFAGDVNGDGFSDVIVGAPYSQGVGSFGGRAYIYFGGTSMDNIADIINKSDYKYTEFGYSVSSAGDVNGDGYSDVIVGEPRYGGLVSGRAYLYLSTPPPVKPRTIEVKDVPYDQGGQVYINFVRSAYDALNESNIITEYVIEMSTPPGVNGFSWAQIGSVQPMQNVYYTFIANTPNDSMTNNSGTYYFRVTARTSNPNQYWRSNIIYGHSVDNLAPLAPAAFNAQLNNNKVSLNWEANAEPDLRDYYIYRSSTPETEALTLIGTTTEISFTDNSPLTGKSHYYVSAYDIHNNESTLSTDSVEAVLSANIRIFIEGAYVGGQMSTFLNSSNVIPLSQPYNTSPWSYAGTESVTSIPQNTVDWVLVELRSTETTVVETRAAFLKNDGTLVDLDGTSNIKFPSTPEGEYYVVIKHRNHLPVMTANKVGIGYNPALYDMRTDLTKAYGTTAMKDLGGGYFGIFTADTDGSGTVNASDRSNAWNQRNLSGYYGTDVDLSGTVNAADRSAVWNNRNITTQVPASTDKLSTSNISGVNENE